jgi:hypothetical protein
VTLNSVTGITQVGQVVAYSSSAVEDFNSGEIDPGPCTPGLGSCTSSSSTLGSGISATGLTGFNDAPGDTAAGTVVARAKTGGFAEDDGVVNSNAEYTVAWDMGSFLFFDEGTPDDLNDDLLGTVDLTFDFTLTWEFEVSAFAGAAADVVGARVHIVLTDDVGIPFFELPYYAAATSLVSNGPLDVGLTHDVLNNSYDFSIDAGLLFFGNGRFAPAGDGSSFSLMATASGFGSACLGGTRDCPLSGAGEGGGGVSVPEPGTLALLGLGLAGMGIARRRRKV